MPLRAYGVHRRARGPAAKGRLGGNRSLPLPLRPTPPAALKAEPKARPKARPNARPRRMRGSAVAVDSEPRLKAGVRAERRPERAVDALADATDSVLKRGARVQRRECARGEGAGSGGAARQNRSLLRRLRAAPLAALKAGPKARPNARLRRMRGSAVAADSEPRLKAGVRAERRPERAIAPGANVAAGGSATKLREPVEPLRKRRGKSAGGAATRPCRFDLRRDRSFPPSFGRLHSRL